MVNLSVLTVETGVASVLSGIVASARRKIYASRDVVVVRRNDYWNAHRLLGYALTVGGVVALTQADEHAHHRVRSVPVSAEAGALHR